MALELAQDLFQLDKTDLGVELTSRIAPEVVWRFELDGDVSIRRIEDPQRVHSLCYYFGGSDLPAADACIAAALLAVTDEADFVYSMFGVTGPTARNRLRGVVGLEHLN